MIQNEIVREKVTIQGQEIAVTRYLNDDEVIPFLRVGQFIVIDKRYVEQLAPKIRQYPYLIVKDTTLLSEPQARDADLRLLERDVDSKYPDGWVNILLVLLLR